MSPANVSSETREREDTVQYCSNCLHVCKGRELKGTLWYALRNRLQVLISWQRKAGRGSVARLQPAVLVADQGLRHAH